MEYVTNLLHADTNPAEWARKREGQGWDVLSVADHFFTARQAFPHVFVAATAMAMATTRPQITTAFVNNLLRSPVEVAQAALQLQQLSDGRFELGLGAGWAREELVAAGMGYPEGRVRASRYIEAVQIVRPLMREGSCHFDGRHYNVHIDSIGPMSDNPPPLVGAVGGPRTTREVTPHLDRVEIKALSASTRNGSLDMAIMAAIPDSHLVEMVEKVRAINPELEIGMFVLCNAGEDEITREFQAALGSGLYSRFYGPPGHVAEGLAWLAEQGISRAQLSPIDDATLDRLVPHLL